MLKQSMCPYFVCGCSYMNPVALKKYSITLEKFGMGVEETAPGLDCYRFYVSVEAGNSIVWEVGKIHWEQAVHENFRQGIIFWS